MDYRDKVSKRECLLMALMYLAGGGIWWYVVFRIYQTPDSYAPLVRVGLTALAGACVIVSTLNWYRWFMYDRKKK